MLNALEIGSLTRRSFSAGAAALLLALSATAVPGGQSFRFASIDGGALDLAEWAGRPVLVVNTASRCGYTDQYDGLQALYDRYRAQGLIVLAVPSGDFRQELESEAAVKEFCELNFDLDLPMTEITGVRGSAAHPFYRWLAAEADVVPTWNFHKVLIGPDGRYVQDWPAPVRPTSRKITRTIEALLAG